MRAKWLRHRQWLEKQNIAFYSLAMAVYSLLGRFVFALVLIPLLLSLPEARTMAAESDVPWLDVLILAPIVETLLSQWLPISVARRLKQSVPVQIGVSALLFSAAHCGSGLAGILAAIIPGIVFAYVWVKWRDRSTWWAIGATSLTHFWVNFLVLSLRCGLKR